MHIGKYTPSITKIGHVRREKRDERDGSIEVRIVKLNNSGTSNSELQPSHLQPSTFEQSSREDATGTVK
jgi:hypothetical protein